MKTRRIDKEQRVWFRSARVFLSEGKWYFHTREGIDMGPYDSQFEAEIEAGILKELLREPTERQGSMEVIRDFVLESYDMGRPLSPSYQDAD